MLNIEKTTKICQIGQTMTGTWQKAIAMFH